MAIEIQKGKPQPPSKFLIMGEPFSGKTTLAAKAPKPLFISTDGNAANSGLDAVNVKSVADIKETVKYFMDHKKEYKTLVIDTIEGVVDIFTEEVLSEFKAKGIRSEEGGELKSLNDMAWGKGTGALNKRIAAFAQALASVEGNVIILSYTKRRQDDISGSIILDSELKNIRLFTKFMHVQVITVFDGEKYKAHLISRRETMAGELDMGEIAPFLKEIGYDMARKSTKVGKVQKR